uniref:trichohyalin-like isoform X2 n=1 Tax=Styela clava TaxID=7725 RepID=UPI00193AAFCF|nr:trichohyalin-like isoform X2 [Styela clava]
MAPGQDDFGEMFDVLDLSKRGYLTLEEVKNFYQSLFYKPVHDLLIKSVLHNYGGNRDDSTCIKKGFEKVLSKLEEARNLEETTYWDFIALDRDGSRVVSVKSCILLARTVNPEFSVQAWHDWLNSRHEPNLPISWQEFQKYMYFIPDQRQQLTNQEDSLEAEFVLLSEKESDILDDKYSEFKEILEDDDDYVAQLQQDRDDYQENVRYESNRLLNRWKIGGAEAVIYDDGTEMARPSVVSDAKNTLTISDLLTALDVKYDMLREKVMIEMAKAESDGTEINSKMIDKILIDIRKREKKARKSKTLDEMLSLPGSSLQYMFTAIGVMGEMADAYLAKWEKAEQRFKSLRAQGKSTKDINKIYEREIMNEMRGSTTSGELLIYFARRQEEEKEYLLRSLRNIPPVSVDAERLSVYASLHRQCLRIEQNESFENAAMSACLTERKQIADFERYNPDRSRQEKLSVFQLEEGNKHSLGQNIPSPAKPDVSHSKNLGLVDSWLEVTRLLVQKHVAERMLMVHFLLGNGIQTKMGTLKNISQKELQSMRHDLTKQHDHLKSSFANKGSAIEKEQQRNAHFDVLTSASALYLENIRRSVSSSSNTNCLSIILARLQVLQDIEGENIFAAMKKMDGSDIYHLRKEIYRSIRDESLENISNLVLGAIKMSAEEKELVDLILAKYDKLRAKLFDGFIKKKNIANDDDRQQLFEKLRIGEEKHRLAGNHAKLAKLCKDTFQIKYSLQEIVGPDPSRFRHEAEHYLDEIKNSGRKRKVVDEPPDLGNISDDSKPRGNLVSELHLRYEDEVDMILENLREAPPNDKTFLLAAEAAWQQWEMMRFNLDDEFRHAAIGLGLCERTKIGQGKIKLRQDNSRYVQLAQERLLVSTSLNTKSLQGMSSSSSPAQSSLRRVLMCHAGDWRKLYELITDDSAEELREAAVSMSEDERTARLAEINSKRMALDIQSPDWQDDLQALLEEAAAIKYVSRMQNLKKLSGEDSGITITNSDVHVSIMADLQEEHDKDGFRWFQKALDEPESAGKIKDLTMAESKNCFNIFNVLCRYEGQFDDDALLQALEDKYDSLRDKLLAEALMKQLGDKAWGELSERERQERLFKLKMEERRLRKEGRYDELAKLLGEAFADDERIKAMLGMSREEYDRKMKERLANRKRGDLGAITEEDDAASLEEGGSGDPLKDLASRYDDEKQALLRMLAGQDQRYMSEKERQMELARLRRELLRAEREEKFGAAALVLGLAERNAEMEKRLASDKKRQEELAKQRLAALKARKGKNFVMPTISEEDEKIIREGSKTEMMDAVLRKLELLYEAERAWLVHILTCQNELKPDQTGIKENDPIKLANARSSSELSDRLHEIDVKLPNQVNIHEYKMPLTEASFFKQGMIVHELMIQPDTIINKEILDVKTLAILQEIQDRKSRKLSEDMATMDDKELIEMQEKNLLWAKQGISNNIPATFFLQAEEDVLDEALEGKFDAILAALVEKALIEKKGEKKWNSMSKMEQDHLIAETTEKIKKLMSEGKTDEALELLGETGKNNLDSLLAMFGLRNEDEERKKLEEERMERMKERIANGMSEEEARRLMEEEKERDEEALKKRRKNILALLQYDLDAQKAELLKQLAESDEKFDQERRRQLELAKLRLQQRMMKRENDLDAVAHVLALSKLSDDQLETERQRQLELARKRLEALRKGRKMEEDNIFPLKLPDDDDINTLIDVIIREMESKHNQERVVLMQLLTKDASPQMDVRKKAASMDEISIQKRIDELREIRRQWRNDDPDNLEENASEQMSILIEATALDLELLIKTNETMSEESAQEEILGKLQNQQMLESSHLIDDLPKKTPATLRMIAKVQWKARSERWLDNVAESLLRKPEVSSQEDEVLKALEDKYDAMKDKLYAEALLRQFGEKEWNDLSEIERQRKVFEIKMKERKLRQEGKMNEAAALISSMIKSDEDLARLLGEVKLSQKEELEKKLEKRRQLKEQRLAAGLAVDDTTLDSEIQKIDEEEKKKRKNVLLLLEHNLDEERDMILASLRKQDEAVDIERRRQLELARLKREQKQIAREDKFNAAAIIFNQAKKSEELLAANLAENRARQLALAKERIAARKAQKEEREAAKKLFDVESITQQLKVLQDHEKNESVSAPERLVQEMDLKQLNERENFLLLLLSTDMDSSMRMQASTMSDEQIKAEKEKIINERKEWREKRFVDLLQGKEDEDETRKSKRRDFLAKSIVEQNKMFKRYLILNLEVDRRAKSDPNQDFTSVKNEMSVKWLADIQTSQASAVEAVHTLITDKSDEVLDMITYGQRKSRIESWNDNLNKVVMGILPPGQMIEPVERQASSMSMGSDQRAVEDTEKQMVNLDEELEEQKKELEKKKKLGEDIDMESALAQLQQQHNAKKQALSSDLDRQRQRLKEKLAARREQRDEMEYEAHAAAAMVFLAERRLHDQEQHQAEAKSKQKSLMEQRLEARRKRRKELEAARKLEEEEAAKQDQDKPKSKMAPPMGLVREKTVVDVQISNEEKEKMLQEMKEISDKMSAKLASDKERARQKVQEKLRDKTAKKRDRVDKIFANFEREKTIVLEKKDRELERQKTMLQDRMHNIRTGKTKTMKEKGDQKVRDFDKLVNPEVSEGMSKDEKMALAAENLQKKFLAEKEKTMIASQDTLETKKTDDENDNKADVGLLSQDDANQVSSDHSASPRSVRMTKEEKEKKMKQRMSIKKKQKLEEESRTLENADEDSQIEFL